MRPNPFLQSCFRPSPLSHRAWDTVLPKSPSSIVLLDEHHQESKQMFAAVTKNWFLENDILLPTKPHLHDYCRRVATLLQGDRIVCFICTSPGSVGSCSVSVHLSRIQTQGGKLLELVMPSVTKSSSKVLTVEAQESALGMLAISDYLYRSHIDFASLDVSDTIEIAAAANRWECQDLFIGSLLHIVYKQRLNEAFSLRSTVSFRWLSQAPPVFVEYFSERVSMLLPQLSFPQLIDLLHCPYLTPRTQLCDQVLQFIAVNDLVQTKLDAKSLVFFYQDIPIPPSFKEYFAVKMARFFFQLYPERNFSDKPYCSEGYEECPELESVPYGAISKPALIKMLHTNMILLDTMRRINETTSIGYDARDLFWTILHYVETLIPDKSKIVALLQRTCAHLHDREGLLSDQSTWNNLSADGMRIAALSLCRRRRSYSPALQFSVDISWDALMTGASMSTAVGSIAGVKFELKARSTTKRTCSWRLYYSNVEGCFESRTGSYARIFYELVNSDCCCEVLPTFERTTRVRLKDRSLRNGSTRDLHTEGELTIFSEQEAEDWCNRHQETCTLSIFVRVEL